MEFGGTVIKNIQYLATIDSRGYLRELDFLEFLLRELDKNQISYETESFENYYPYQRESILKANGQKIDCLGSSFISGSFKAEEFDLVDSTSDLNANLVNPNINFNPYCVNSISRPCFYNTPSVAINFHDKSKIENAQEIECTVTVEKIKYVAGNVLVGNSKNPNTIVFCHLDTIGMGAVDNISGFAFCLEFCKQKSDYLDRVLFVFSSNEELSYDEYSYWGAGYRFFEKKHLSILDNAEKIIVIDCIGYEDPIVHRNLGIIELGFPVKSTSIKKKSCMIAGSIENLLPFYHSEIDVPKLLNKKYVGMALDEFIRLI